MYICTCIISLSHPFAIISIFSKRRNSNNEGIYVDYLDGQDGGSGTDWSRLLREYIIQDATAPRALLRSLILSLISYYPCKLIEYISIRCVYLYIQC